VATGKKGKKKKKEEKFAASGVGHRRGEAQFLLGILKRGERGRKKLHTFSFFSSKGELI